MKPSALRAIPAETTAAKYKDPSWQAPRTPWGHPDIQGTWSSDDMRGIPQERNANHGTRDTLTPEEFQQRAGNLPPLRIATSAAVVPRWRVLASTFGWLVTRLPFFNFATRNPLC